MPSEEAEAVDAEGVSQEEAEVVEAPEERGRGRASQKRRRSLPRPPRSRRGLRGACRAGGRSARGEPSPKQKQPPKSKRAVPRQMSRGPRKRSRPRARRTRVLNASIAKPSTARGGLVELVVIVALALGLALGIQAFLIKPYQIPSGSMEPTLDIGQRVLVNRFIYHFSSPGDRRHRRLSPARRARTATDADAAEPRGPNQPCAMPTEQTLGPELHQADRRRPGRHAELDPQRPPGGQRGRPGAISSSPAATECPTCNLPKPITIPPGPLLHDGRQPWVKRRQPVLGTGPARLVHRQSLRHLLAAGPSRDLLSRQGRQAGQASPAPAAAHAAPVLLRPLAGHRLVAGCDEAGRGSLAGPAGRRRGPDRLRGAQPLRPPCPRRPARLKADEPRRAREALPQCPARGDAGQRRGALRARHRRARPAQHQHRGALGDPGAGRP